MCRQKDSNKKDLLEVLPSSKNYNNIFIFYIDRLLGKKCNLGFINIIISVVLFMIPIVKKDWINNILTNNDSYAWFFSIFLGMAVASMLFEKRNYKKEDEYLNLDLLKQGTESYNFLSDEEINEDLLKFINKECDDILKRVLAIFGFAIPLYKFYIDTKLLDVEYVIPYVGLIVLSGAVGYYSMTLGYEKVVFKNIIEHIRIENLYEKINHMNSDEE